MKKISWLIKLLKKPLGGAHQNREKVFNTVKNEILESFKELKAISISSLLKKRSDRYISMGVFSD